MLKNRRFRDNRAEMTVGPYNEKLSGVACWLKATGWGPSSGDAKEISYRRAAGYLHLAIGRNMQPRAHIFGKLMAAEGPA
jgi:hypothetical protein